MPAEEEGGSRKILNPIAPPPQVAEATGKGGKAAAAKPAAAAPAGKGGLWHMLGLWPLLCQSSPMSVSTWPVCLCSPFAELESCFFVVDIAGQAAIFAGSCKARLSSLIVWEVGPSEMQPGLRSLSLSCWVSGLESSAVSYPMVSICTPAPVAPTPAPSGSLRLPSSSSLTAGRVPPQPDQADPPRIKPCTHHRNCLHSPICSRVPLPRARAGAQLHASHSRTATPAH